MDHDGNILDCACLATISALLHFKRPDVSIEDGEVIIVSNFQRITWQHSANEKSPISLSIHHLPISVTFGIIGKDEKHFIDPSLKEELVQDGQVTVVMNMHREICTLLTSGGTPLELDKLFLCTSVSSSKVTEITKIIRESMQATSHQSS